MLELQTQYIYKSVIDIDDHAIRTIKHCRKSLLFHNNEAWKKKTTPTCFDVTMGSFDGTELCELVGIYLLSKLLEIIPKDQSGLYHDDSLLLLRKMNGQKTDKIRKQVIKLFKDAGFLLEIETKLKQIDFLNVTLNLNTGLHLPYKKPNDTLLYISTSSNHPPQVIRQLPNSINKRLYKNSSNKEVFNSVKQEYKMALKKSGYNSNLKYINQNKQRSTNKRSRNIIWFNPPFSQTVKTNVAKKFFHLLDKQFSKAHLSHRVFNRNTVKVSYSCMNNISQIIKQHKKHVSKKKEIQTPKCNCRNKNDCPMNGNCKVNNVIYKRTVSATPTFKQRVYLGIAE